MKKTLLFLMAAFYCLEMFAQRNIDGVYIDIHNVNHRIEVSNGRLRLIKQDAWQPYLEYLCADASYEWIDDEFIEFHSEKPANVVDSLLEVKKINGNEITGNEHKKNIKVLMPGISCTILDITVFFYLPKSEWQKGDTKRVSQHQADFSVSNKATKIYLKIEHNDIYWNYRAGLSTGNDVLYDSYLAYKTPVLNLYYDCTEITINGIDDDYFGRYYINGEYAKVIGDKIIWRGRIFEKKND